MWFDARAALEGIEGQERPKPATTGQRDSRNSQDSQGWAAHDMPQAQRDRGKFAEFARFATSRPKANFAAQYAREARPVSDEGEVFPYGTACNLGDTPRTWNGHVVSLAKWHRLSEWEKHGPNGRIWCGLCRCWHMPGDCTGGQP
jgi:hypothetical protein